MTRRLALTLLLAAIAPSAASAQDPLGPARDAFDRADFRGAVQAYDRVADTRGLTREQLVELLRGRALARHAARDAAGAEADLVALLSVEPAADLGELAPPALQRAFARLRAEPREPVAIEVTATPIPDGFSVRTEVQNDVASLVRVVRVRYRDGGTWRTADGDDVRLLAERRLEYLVEAIGPGGAVLAHRGTEHEPLVAGASIVVPYGGTPPPRDDTVLLVAVATSSAVAVAVIAIILAVALAPSGVQPTAPIEMR